jgi:hypothetical protein
MIGAATTRIDIVANVVAEADLARKSVIYHRSPLADTKALSTFGFLFDTVYPSPKFNRQKPVTFCIATSLVVFISLFDE